MTTTMRAALYCRKSTSEEEMRDEDTSVTRQIEHARRYAEGQGWTVDADHIFTDPGISGAEFANRPGFVRLMAALKQTPRPFDVLVMSEESRLGREAIATGYALLQIVQAGVRVFFYLSKSERTLDSPQDKILMALSNFAGEMERTSAAARSHDKATQQARGGHVTGSRTFGYDHACSVCGTLVAPGTRAWCCGNPATGKGPPLVRVINPAEAAVVQAIFERSATGTGLTRLAHELNAERAICPRPQRARPAGWSPSVIRDVLHREIYRGTVTWNKSKKKDRWGRKHQLPRPESEWVRKDHPELRLVSDELWQRVHERLAGIRRQLQSAQGARPVVCRDQDSRFLLAGFARCALCGGGLSAIGRDHGRQRVHFYGCTARYKKGPTFCANTLLLPVGVVDRAVLASLAAEALRPAIVTAILDTVFEALHPEAVTRNTTTLRTALAAVDRKIEHLESAIEDGQAAAPLAKRLTARLAEREGILKDIAAASVVGQLKADRAVIEQTVRQRVASWTGLLSGSIAEGRQLLREAVEGPIRFTPEGDAYAFSGEAVTGRLIAGLVRDAALGASPAGFEPAFWP